MVDAALEAPAIAKAAVPRTALRKAMQRKSTIAFLMTLPLILLIALLVIYPALYAIHLATLNKSMERFVGLGNFTFLFKRETFWMVVQQSCIFAITAVIFKALIGFIVAHFVHNIPSQGPAQVARHAAGALGHPAGHELRSPGCGCSIRPTARSTGCWRSSASARCPGPAMPTGRASRSSWSMSGSARRSS